MTGAEPESTAPRTVESLYRPPYGFASDRVGILVWALEEQRRALIADTRGLTPEDLEWQHARG